MRYDIRNHRPVPNLTKAEMEALKILMQDDTLIIKPADKVRAVVFFMFENNVGLLRVAQLPRLLQICLSAFWKRLSFTL